MVDVCAGLGSDLLGLWNLAGVVLRLLHFRTSDTGVAYPLHQALMSARRNALTCHSEVLNLTS